MKCSLCGSDDEVRPYGPTGSMICFNCAFATPERAAETERAFLTQLEACGPGVVVLGEVTGPRALNPNKTLLN
jgi:hypothetical protein